MVYTPPVFVASTTRAATSGHGGITRILDMIEGVLPGIQDTIVQVELFSAIEEFCTLSNYWRKMIYWRIPAGVEAVNLNDPYMARIDPWENEATNTVDYPFVITNIFEILPPSNDRTQIFNSAFNDGFDWSRVAGSKTNPLKYLAHPRRVEIAPPAIIIDRYGIELHAQRAGRAICTLKPSELSDAAVPAFISGGWSEALRDGTLFRLYRQPGKPYTDAKIATYYGKRFRNQIMLARTQAREFIGQKAPLVAYFANGRQRSYSSEFNFGFAGRFGGSNGGLQ